MKIHSTSCEVKYFVETYLCKQTVCDTPIEHITGFVSSLWIWVGDSPCNHSAAIRVNMRVVSQSVHGHFQLVSEVDKI